MPLSTAETQADILVAGAGAAGLSTAIALAQAGFSVVCVGHVDTRANERTVALFEASLRFYKALGVWPHFRGKTAPLARGSSAKRGPVSILVADGECRRWVKRRNSI